MIVVEHDEAVIRAADWVVDLGPGAGPDGGLDRRRRAGPSSSPRRPASITGRYLRGRRLEPPRRADRLERSPGWITIRGATVHNLKDVEARIPLGALTCVTGVSGSGKSTLVHDVLARGYRRRDRTSAPRPGRVCGADRGLEAIETLDRGRSDARSAARPRSTPATFTGVFDQIRRVFATTREAKMRGLRRRPVQLQRQGGPVRGLRGPGPAPDPHAVPARPVRRSARSARASGSTARRWRSGSRASRSATCWSCGSTRPGRSSTPSPGCCPASTPCTTSGSAT